ncbi:MAG: hypothetical protein K1000chlam2_00020 [Chlamydiae bacterium]|nr:hypothetical protein [Chlamydiota bacterium]
MAHKQGYNDRMDERLGMKNGADKYMDQSYKARRNESRGMAKSESNYANEKYMEKGMAGSGKVMGHDKSPSKVGLMVGYGFKEIKPFHEGKGYPKQAYDYKY